MLYYFYLYVEGCMPLLQGPEVLGVPLYHLVLRLEDRPFVEPGTDTVISIHHIHQPVNPSYFPVSAHSMLRLQMCAGSLPDLRRVLEHRLQSSPCSAILHSKHFQPPSHCSSPLSSFHMTSVRILVRWSHKYLPHCPLTCGSSSLFFIF